VTIHDTHPFADPPERRDPLRRLRGRLGTTVTVWTAGDAQGRAGLTVSSLMVAAGEPGHVLALVDPDSDLAEVAARTGAVSVSLLEWRHRHLAEAFAGTAPAPGGPFTTGTWVDTPWGPRLADASAWVGLRLRPDPAEVGWSLLLDGVVEEIELADGDAPLVQRRGRWVRPDGER
jgi:flavin reductase (DIM6/NTAB) family NADH-FMN oxidoreductase RutF